MDLSVWGVRPFFTGIFLVLFLNACVLSVFSNLLNAAEYGASLCSYDVVGRFDHDPQAFTQGLCYAEGDLYEGTGLYGQSSLRRMRPGSAAAEIRLLPATFFGEGVTVFKDKVIQLTWKSGTGFVWDRNNLQLERVFAYPLEGWGITHDTFSLIMSDGSASLYFLDPENFALRKRLTVVHGNEPVQRLNELEYIRGEIWANIWKDNRIVRIDPQSGKVIAWIDLSDLINEEGAEGAENVLNGIAYDADNDRIFVTGKRWNTLYEIRVDNGCKVSPPESP